MSLIADNASATGGFVIPPVPIWRLSVDQYHEMIRTGILTEDDPIELLDGWLVTKTGKPPRHSVATGLIRDALNHFGSEGWHVDSHGAVTLDTSEPEPDVMIVRGNIRDYGSRHPSAADVALVVEVADDSLARDRTLKKRIYAEAGIAVYWIVNLLERRLEVYTDPTGPAAEPDYRRRQDFGPAEHVPVLLDGREVAQLAVHTMLP